VALPQGHTGSSLFHAVLLAAQEKYPHVFGQALLPRSASLFKRDYGAILARFEAARAAAPDRVDIARFILRHSQAALEFVEQGRRMPLSEHLDRTAEPLDLDERKLGEAPGFRPELPLDGTVYRGRDVCRAIQRLAEQQHMTTAARLALDYMVDSIEQQGGTLDLRGHNFVLLGAGAELAPTELLLSAGARVLWIDVSDPDRWLSARRGLAGTLVHARGATHLLEKPAVVAATIRQFANQVGPVHLGMFAYASGASQEWRLGAAMNAIASQLPPSDLRSISLLVSPTSPATLQPESVEAALAELGRAPRWKSALRRAGLLPTPGHSSNGSVHIARATVSIQGLSYQAAQYITKLMAAESYAVHGTSTGATSSEPRTVSANVAGITRTRSLAHPLFQAAFVGAPHFGVRIFEPETTRALSGLLIAHDLLNPVAPGAAAVEMRDPRQKAATLFSQQVHGGIYNLPYVLENAIRIAALIGMGRKPSVLVGRKAAPAHAAALG
jgi:hypothetical protein